MEINEYDFFLLKMSLTGRGKMETTVLEQQQQQKTMSLTIYSRFSTIKDLKKSCKENESS